MALRRIRVSLPYDPRLNERARELRNNQTEPEKRLWQILRRLPVRVHRQKVIDRFIVDFYIASQRLVIEVDGESHFNESGESYDAERTKVLEGYGLRVARFTNREVMQELEGVCETIGRLLRLGSDQPASTPYKHP